MLRNRVCNIMIYTLFDGLAAFQLYGLSSIATQVVHLYSVSLSYVFWQSTAFVLVSIFFSPLASIIIANKGIKYSLVIALITLIIGSWLRILINFSFSFAFVGQLIAGIAYSIVRTALTQLSAHWFRPSQVGSQGLIIENNFHCYCYCNRLCIWSDRVLPLLLDN